MCFFHPAHLSSNPSALSVLHLSLMQTSVTDHLLFYSRKSSIPGADLISFRAGIVTMDVYVSAGLFQFEREQVRILDLEIPMLAGQEI